MEMGVADRDISPFNAKSRLQFLLRIHRPQPHPSEYTLCREASLAPKGPLPSSLPPFLSATRPTLLEWPFKKCASVCPTPFFDHQLPRFLYRRRARALTARERRRRFLLGRPGAYYSRALVVLAAEELCQLSEVVALAALLVAALSIAAPHTRLVVLRGGGGARKSPKGDRSRWMLDDGGGQTGKRHQTDSRSHGGGGGG